MQPPNYFTHVHHVLVDDSEHKAPPRRLNLHHGPDPDAVQPVAAQEPSRAAVQCGSRSEHSQNVLPHNEAAHDPVERPDAWVAKAMASTNTNYLLHCLSQCRRKTTRAMHEEGRQNEPRKTPTDFAKQGAPATNSAHLHASRATACVAAGRATTLG